VRRNQAPGHSCGGHQWSGIGREYSLEGMVDSFTQRKTSRSTQYVAQAVN
jgi:hypothetical protein